MTVDFMVISKHILLHLLVGSKKDRFLISYNMRIFLEGGDAPSTYDIDRPCSSLPRSSEH